MASNCAEPESVIWPKSVMQQRRVSEHNSESTKVECLQNKKQKCDGHTFSKPEINQVEPTQPQSMWIHKS